MARLLTLSPAAGPTVVIAARGTEEDNTLPYEIPDIEESEGEIIVPAGEKAQESMLTQALAGLVFSRPNLEVLVSIEGTTATYWVMEE